MSVPNLALGHVLSYSFEPTAMLWATHSNLVLNDFNISSFSLTKSNVSFSGSYRVLTEFLKAPL